MKAKSIIRFENVTARLRDKWIFPATSWEIAKGEHWAVLGPNGAGKSSLMRLVLDEIPAVRGWIVRSYDADRFKLGHVSFELEDWFLSRSDLPGQSASVLDTLVHGSNEKLEIPESAAILERFEIVPLLKRDIRSLSTGELRRVLIARAFLKRPGLLILDEPFTGLDPETRRRIAGMIDTAAKTGTQLVLVTNRPEEILPCITRVVCVKECRILDVGGRDILSRKMLAKLYGIDHVPSELPVQGSGTGKKSPGKPLVRMKKVTVTYGGRTILNGIDWTIRKGEHWAVLGPNGSGKSTLLNLMTGDNLQGYANEIYLFGKRKGTGETVWEIKRRIGAVSTQLQLSYRKETTARDAVASGFFDSSGLYRKTGPSLDKKVSDWMDLLGIAHLAEKKFGRLSFGEKKMITIARAVVKDPELLLLDEPCAGLDGAHRKRISELMEAIALRGRSVIVLVTHHPEELPPCINRILRLDRSGRSSISNRQSFPGARPDAAFSFGTD